MNGTIANMGACLGWFGSSPEPEKPTINLTKEESEELPELTLYAPGRKLLITDCDTTMLGVVEGRVFSTGEQLREEDLDYDGEIAFFDSRRAITLKTRYGNFTLIDHSDVYMFGVED